ncbi:MAG: hypothetical protein HY269_09145 [Deltaproteobacteria bacterium]|nr:hypothetical protein [Deltaproteobacteria bacterium]
MRSVITTIRCVPRLGCDFAQVRTIELGLAPGFEHGDLRDALDAWFCDRGMQDAVYDVQTDDSGYFAVLNDEVYHEEWGVPLL